MRTFHPRTFIAVMLASAPCTALAQAAPVPLLSYQGRLMENGQAVTGTRSFAFSILDATGKELWNSGNLTLEVNGGLYAVELGSGTMPAIPPSVLQGAGLQLHITLSGQGLAPDVGLVPELQALSAWNFITPLTGDVTGAQNETRLASLQGYPLDLLSAPPVAGQTLVFDGLKWTAAVLPGSQGVQGPAGPAGATGPAGPPGIAGPAGPAGATGATGPAGANGNTILSGPGDPATTVGIDGNFYLNTVSLTFFGPKVSGGWGAGISLLGPAGSQGGAGPTGPAGPAGPAGPIGPAGPAGATGAPGASPFTLNGATAAYASGPVAIGAAAASPSAVLDLETSVRTPQGLLPPGTPTSTRTSFQSLNGNPPADGLALYDTDKHRLFIWSAGSNESTWNQASPQLVLEAWADAGNVLGKSFTSLSAWHPAPVVDVYGAWSSGSWTAAESGTYYIYFQLAGVLPATANDCSVQAAIWTGTVANPTLIAAPGTLTRFLAGTGYGGPLLSTLQGPVELAAHATVMFLGRGAYATVATASTALDADFVTSSNYGTTPPTLDYTKTFVRIYRIR